MPPCDSPWTHHSRGSRGRRQEPRSGESHSCWGQMRELFCESVQDPRNNESQVFVLERKRREGDCERSSTIGVALANSAAASRRCQCRRAGSLSPIISSTNVAWSRESARLSRRNGVERARRRASIIRSWRLCVTHVAQLPPLGRVIHDAFVAISVSLRRASQASTWKLRAVPRRHHSQKCSQLLVNSR